MSTASDGIVELQNRNLANSELQLNSNVEYDQSIPTVISTLHTLSTDDLYNKYDLNAVTSVENDQHLTVLCQCSNIQNSNINCQFHSIQSSKLTDNTISCNSAISPPNTLKYCKFGNNHNDVTCLNVASHLCTRVTHINNTNNLTDNTVIAHASDPVAPPNVAQTLQSGSLSICTRRASSSEPTCRDGGALYKNSVIADETFCSAADNEASSHTPKQQSDELAPNFRPAGGTRTPTHQLPKKNTDEKQNYSGHNDKDGITKNFSATSSKSLFTHNDMQNSQQVGKSTDRPTESTSTNNMSNFSNINCTNIHDSMTDVDFSQQTIQNKGKVKLSCHNSNIDSNGLKQNGSDVFMIDDEHKQENSAKFAQNSISVDFVEKSQNTSKSLEIQQIQSEQNNSKQDEALMSASVIPSDAVSFILYLPKAHYKTISTVGTSMTAKINNFIKQIKSDNRLKNKAKQIEESVCNGIWDVSDYRKSGLTTQYRLTFAHSSRCVNMFNLFKPHLNNKDTYVVYTKRKNMIKIFPVKYESSFSNTLMELIRQNVNQIHIEHAKIGYVTADYLIASVTDSQLIQLKNCIDNLSNDQLKQNITVQQRVRPAIKYCLKCDSDGHYTNHKCRVRRKCLECKSNKHSVIECDQNNIDHQCKLCSKNHYESKCTEIAFRWTTIAHRQYRNTDYKQFANKTIQRMNKQTYADVHRRSTYQPAATTQHVIEHNASMNDQQQQIDALAQTVRQIADKQVKSDAEMRQLHRQLIEKDNTIRRLQNEVNEWKAKLKNQIDLTTDHSANAKAKMQTFQPTPANGNRDERIVIRIPKSSIKRRLSGTTKQNSNNVGRTLDFSQDNNDMKEDDGFITAKPGRHSASHKSIEKNAQRIKEHLNKFSLLQKQNEADDDQKVNTPKESPSKKQKIVNDTDNCNQFTIGIAQADSIISQPNEAQMTVETSTIATTTTTKSKRQPRASSNKVKAKGTATLSSASESKTPEAKSNSKKPKQSPKLHMKEKDLHLNNRSNFTKQLQTSNNTNSDCDNRSKHHQSLHTNKVIDDEPKHD